MDSARACARILLGVAAAAERVERPRRAEAEGTTKDEREGKIVRKGRMMTPCVSMDLAQLPQHRAFGRSEARRPTTAHAWSPCEATGRTRRACACRSLDERNSSLFPSSLSLECGEQRSNGSASVRQRGHSIGQIPWSRSIRSGNRQNALGRACAKVSYALASFRPWSTAVSKSWLPTSVVSRYSH